MKDLIGYHRLTKNDDGAKSALDRLSNFALQNCLTQKQGPKYFFTYVDRSSDAQEGFEELLNKVGENTALLIERLEVLGDTWGSVEDHLQQLMSKSVRVMVIDLPSTTGDYSMHDSETEKLLISQTNNLLCDMCKYLAAEKTDNTRKNTCPKIKMGRPRAMSYEVFKMEYQKVLNKQLSSVELMEALGVSKATFYRYREQYMKERQDSNENSINMNCVIKA